VAGVVEEGDCRGWLEFVTVSADKSLFLIFLIISMLVSLELSGPHDFC